MQGGNTEGAQQTSEEIISFSTPDVEQLQNSESKEKEEYTIFMVGQDGSREATYNIGVETLFRLKIAGSTVTSYTSPNYNSYTMGLANLNFYEDKGYVEGYTKAKGNICFTLNGADGNTYTVKLNIMEVDDSNHFHTITWNVVKEPSKEAAACLEDFGWREGHREHAGKGYAACSPDGVLLCAQWSK